jgi:hypothetical protein
MCNRKSEEGRVVRENVNKKVKMHENSDDTSKRATLYIRRF